MKRILVALLLVTVLALGTPFGSGKTHAQDTDVLVDLGANGADMEIDEVRHLLYVTLPTLNEVVFISTVTFQIVRRVVVGSSPYGIDLSSDGSQLYIALNGAGSVKVLDPDTLAQSEIVVATELGSSLAFDVIEGRANRLFVSANPGSSGFSYIVMIKLDQGNQAVRVANQRIIRASPVFEGSPDQTVLYVGEGFSPNSLYKLDITDDTAPIILEDQHGTVSGTRFLEVNGDGTRIYLGSGQVLRTDSFTQAALIGSGVPQFGDLQDSVFVAVEDSPAFIETYDTSTFLKKGPDVVLPCSVDPFTNPGIARLVALPGNGGWLALANNTLCGFLPDGFEPPLSNPASKVLISGPLKEDGLGGLAPFFDFDEDGLEDEGSFVLVNQDFAQHYAARISVTNTGATGALDDLLVLDSIPQGFVMDGLGEDAADGFSDGICDDGSCDGVQTDPACPAVINGPGTDPQLVEEFVVIEAIGLAKGAMCQTTVYVATKQIPSKGKKKRNRFEPISCATVTGDSGQSVNDTIIMNAGVKVLDGFNNDLLFGPSGSINLTAVGCP